MNKELNLTTTEEIQNLIYNIRGKQVMLDSDVANLYHTETRAINQALKRNIDRFPEEFCFQLTEDEMENMRSQIVIAYKRNNRYLPYVFTEQGIIMLSSLLKSETAIKVSVKIVEAFVKMRHFLKDNGELFERVTTLEYQQIENNKKFDLVFDKIHEKQIKNQRIFFDGQIYDAYSLIIDIIKRAKNKITIIDNYIDDSV